MIGPIYAAPIQTCEDASNVPWAKPIRLFQFILILILFVLTYHTVYQDSPYTETEANAIFALLVAFLVITLVDIVSQCGSDPIPDTPMFLFGVLGTVAFFVALIYMSSASKRDDAVGVWRLIVSVILSFGCSILFLLDITLIFLYGY